MLTILAELAIQDAEPYRRRLETWGRHVDDSLSRHDSVLLRMADAAQTFAWLYCAIFLALAVLTVWTYHKGERRIRALEARFAEKTMLPTS